MVVVSCWWRSGSVDPDMLRAFETCVTGTWESSQGFGVVQQDLFAVHWVDTGRKELQVCGLVGEGERLLRVLVNGAGALIVLQARSEALRSGRSFKSGVR